MASSENFAAACNTIKASRWTLLLARLFGQKVCGIDDWGGERVIATGYRWRGVLYMMSFDRFPIAATDRGSDGK